MSAEIAIRTATPNSLESKIRYAQALSDASMLPAAYRSKPANVLLAVELGEALGIPSIQAINGIHVIDGKPSASADLISSLVRRAGHKLRVTVNDAEQWALAVIIRADDPDFTYEARWDKAKATAAGLWGKGNWAKYPGQMLRNRAITEVARMGASDALYGVIYTPEELGVDTNAEGEPTITVTQTDTTAASSAKPPSLQDAIAAKRALEVVPEPAVDVEPEPQPEPVSDLRTPAQATKLAILMREVGLDKDRGEALAYFADIIGHPVESTKELSKGEASKLIENLTQMAADNIQPLTGEVVDAEIVESSDWPAVAQAGGAR